MINIPSNIVFPIDDLCKLLRPNPQAITLEKFALCIQRIALSYLQVRSLNDCNLVDRLGITINDFAFDAIADIFEKDSQGRHFRIIESFQDLGPPESLTEEQFLYGIRRLASTYVNRRIFKSYRDLDPALAKIIRNVKIPLTHHRSLFLTDLFGVPTIRLEKEKPSTYYKHPIPPELLHAEFFSRLTSKSTIPKMLTLLSQTLCDLEEYQQSYPLVGVALLFKEAFLSQGNLPEQSTTESDTVRMDIEKSIHIALDSVEKKKLSAYVATGKIQKEEVNLYAGTIQTILQNTFLGSNGHEESYFTILKDAIPTLTQAEYQRNHRTKLEYLAKKAKEIVKNQLRNDYGSLQREKDARK